MDETKVLLSGVIEDGLKNLDKLEDGSKEKSAAIDGLSKLYQLKIEEERSQAAHIENMKRLEQEHNQSIIENSQKSEQLKEQSIDRWINFGLQVGIAVGGWIAYDRWNRRGLKFEETGTVTSPLTRNLMSKMLPSLKMK
mgnify:CR=1 FL=1